MTKLVGRDLWHSYKKPIENHPDYVPSSKDQFCRKQVIMSVLPLKTTIVSITEVPYFPFPPFINLI